MTPFRDKLFFYDCAIGDLTAGQITKAILRSTWPDADKEIYEHDLQEQRYAKKRTNK